MPGLQGRQLVAGVQAALEVHHQTVGVGGDGGELPQLHRGISKTGFHRAVLGGAHVEVHGAGVVDHSR